MLASLLWYFITINCIDNSVAETCLFVCVHVAEQTILSAIAPLLSAVIEVTRKAFNLQYYSGYPCK